MAVVRLLGLEDESIDFTFSTNPEKSIDFEGAQKWASLPVPRQEGSILQDMGSDALTFKWNGVFDGENAFSDVNILDTIRRTGAPLQFIYSDLNIPCVITGFTFRLSTPFADVLDRFFYEIKFQKYYPFLAGMRTLATDFSLTGEELSTLSNKTTDLGSQLDRFKQLISDVQNGLSKISEFENEIMMAVADVEGTVVDALGAAVSTLDTLRQGIQLPVYLLEQTKQQLQDASTLVRQAVLEVGSILDTPDELMTTLRDMTVSLDFIAAAPFISESAVTTVVTEDGDTLEALAYYFYSSFESWRVIYFANKPLIPDPHSLAPGITLSIPL